MDLSKLNVMLDMETFSMRSNAVIISIGATKFDESGIKDTFFVNVNPKDGMELGFDINKDTLNWWKKQKEGVLKQSLKDAIPLSDGIKQFLDWYGNKSLVIWAKGSCFDIPIIENHIVKLDLQIPWKYWDVKCHRTIEGLIDPKGDMKPAATGDLHNALVDAQLQAEHLINIWKSLNG